MREVTRHLFMLINFYPREINCSDTKIRKCFVRSKCLMSNFNICGTNYKIFHNMVGHPIEILFQSTAVGRIDLSGLSMNNW